MCSLSISSIKIIIIFQSRVQIKVHHVGGRLTEGRVGVRVNELTGWETEEKVD